MLAMATESLMRKRFVTDFGRCRLPALPLYIYHNTFVLCGTLLSVGGPKVQSFAVKHFLDKQMGLLRDRHSYLLAQ